MPLPRAVIVASTRTGSSWLASLLDSHPDIGFHGELFNLERASVRALADPAGYLDELLQEATGCRLVGFKLLYHQARLEYLNDFLSELDEGRSALVDWRLHFPQRPVTVAMAPSIADLWEMLRDARRYRILHLRRRNILRQLVSHELLLRTSRDRWQGRPLALDRPIRLDPQSLVERLQRHAQDVADIASFLGPNGALEVYYEDLASDFDRQCSNILRFLQVRPLLLYSSTRRNESRSLRETIDNYSEVEGVLAPTRWAPLLEEPFRESHAAKQQNG